MGDNPAALRSLMPGTPAALEQAIGKYLCKKPFDRYQDVTELLSDLNSIEPARAEFG
jgi:hypothetical protein